MDWFEEITGFKETTYDRTRSAIYERDGRLCSRHSSRTFAIGDFCLPSLKDLRASRASSSCGGRLTVRNVSGDARSMHSESKYKGALFQVASQFNMLEMVAPHITPEDGVTRYARDLTQGPACAIAAGAGTIYRNYQVPIGDQKGQTAIHQIDGLLDLGTMLSELLDTPISRLWKMKNGYALATVDGLSKIDDLLSRILPAEREALKEHLRIGLQEGTQVTDGEPGDEILISQAFCSALPVAYSTIPSAGWKHFARFILEAAYEATLLAGLRNASRGKSNKVLLTRLGGGAFGNNDRWIDEAMIAALDLVVEKELEVLLVSYGPAPENMLEIARRYA